MCISTRTHALVLLEASRPSSSNVNICATSTLKTQHSCWSIILHPILILKSYKQTLLIQIQLCFPLLSPCSELNEKGGSIDRHFNFFISLSTLTSTVTYCKSTRELTLSHYTKRWISEQLIVQLHSSIYGVGPWSHRLQHSSKPTRITPPPL